MELHKGSPHSCDKLIPPNLVNEIERTSRDVAEEPNNGGSGCLEARHNFVNNKKYDKPNQIH